MSNYFNVDPLPIVDRIRKLLDAGQQLKAGFEQGIYQTATNNLSQGRLLSVKQAQCLTQIADRLEKSLQPQDSNIDISDYNTLGIFERFKQVIAKGAKRLKIYSNLLDGSPMTISYGDKGAPTLWLNGSGFADKLGRVTDTGNYQAPYGLSTDKQVMVLQTLKAIGDDPIGYAKAYGKHTNRCMFCGHLLTDEKEKRGVMSSVDRGYGPVCGHKWGLPV